MKKKFTDRVYEVVAKIPRGEVMTYKQVAEVLGCKAYQAVGQALARNPYAPEVPCHRVVRSDGNVGGFGGKADNYKKVLLLRKEGIVIVKGKVCA